MNVFPDCTGCSTFNNLLFLISGWFAKLKRRTFTNLLYGHIEFELQNVLLRRGEGGPTLPPLEGTAHLYRPEMCLFISSTIPLYVLLQMKFIASFALITTK